MEIPPCNGTLIYETILKALFQQNQKYANQIENSVIEQYLNFEIQIFKKPPLWQTFVTKQKNKQQNNNNNQLVHVFAL